MATRSALSFLTYERRSIASHTPILSINFPVWTYAPTFFSGSTAIYLIGLRLLLLVVSFPPLQKLCLEFPRAQFWAFVVYDLHRWYRPKSRHPARSHCMLMILPSTAHLLCHFASRHYCHRHLGGGSEIFEATCHFMLVSRKRTCSIAPPPLFVRLVPHCSRSSLPSTWEFYWHQTCLGMSTFPF